jgi:hypothetical protein
MIRRHAIALLVAIPVAVVTTPGCSSDTKATPQVVFDGSLQHGATTNDCREDGPLFTIGDFGNPSGTPPTPANPIPDGQPFAQGTVSVACSVTASGADQFNVTASVLLSGVPGGLFRIDGVFKTTGDQPSIHAQFANNLSTNNYDELDHNCTVRYTTPFQGVAAGRIWGSITCPKAENQGAQTACEADAEFRFENCEQ